MSGEGVREVEVVGDGFAETVAERCDAGGCATVLRYVCAAGG